MAYFAEYTDTFGGETNYAWVRRVYIETADSVGQALRKARGELGLTGVRGDIVAQFGDETHWKPRGCCTLLMVRWDDTPPEHRYSSAAVI
jgi:hypothetical protein